MTILDEKPGKTAVSTRPASASGGDSEAFRSALGVGDVRWEATRRFGDLRSPHYGRADMYRDGTSFKLLEFNITGTSHAMARGAAVFHQSEPPAGAAG